MKGVILWILFLASCFPSMADMGNSSVFKVEVSYQSKKAIGFVSKSYYNFYEPELNKVYYKTDTMFNSVLSNLLHYQDNDTVFLYKEIYSIDSLGLTIFFKDKLLIVPQNQITSVKYISIKDVTDNLWVSSER